MFKISDMIHDMIRLPAASRHKAGGFESRQVAAQVRPQGAIEKFGEIRASFPQDPNTLPRQEGEGQVTERFQRSCRPRKGRQSSNPEIPIRHL